MRARAHDKPQKYPYVFARLFTEWAKSRVKALFDVDCATVAIPVERIGRRLGEEEKKHKTKDARGRERERQWSRERDARGFSVKDGINDGR